MRLNEITTPYAGIGLSLSSLKQHRGTSHGKSKGLSNQQETAIGATSALSSGEVVVCSGSSETITRSPSLFNFSTFSRIRPQHITRYKQSFLEWFVGFVEGGGCFGINYNNNRVSFLINQKDPKVLYFIRKQLGFGTVRKYKKYFRYNVSDRANLSRLIALFSGNLVLQKARVRFSAWTRSFEAYYRASLPVIVPVIPVIGLQDA